LNSACKVNLKSFILYGYGLGELDKEEAILADEVGRDNSLTYLNYRCDKSYRYILSTSLRTNVTKTQCLQNKFSVNNVNIDYYRLAFYLLRIDSPAGINREETVEIIFINAR